MKKSEELKMGNNLSFREQVFSGDVKAIEKGITSLSNLERIYAIRGCVINNVKTQVVIEALKKLKTVDEFEFCAHIGSCATAALHLLGIEKYEGTNVLVLDAIESKFEL